VNGISVYGRRKRPGKITSGLRLLRLYLMTQRSMDLSMFHMHSLASNRITSIQELTIVHSTQGGLSKNVWLTIENV
jgi:uncharacterized circularly permuted ATP-grasp superfamily protein